MSNTFKYKKNITFFISLAIAISAMVLCMELYYTQYYWVCEINLNNQFFDKLLIDPIWIVFNSLKTRIFCLLILFICLVDNTTNDKKDLGLNLVKLLFCSFVFVGIKLIPTNNIILFYFTALTTCVLFIFIIRLLYKIAPFLNFTNVDLSENDKNSDGFEQTTKKIETEDSVNIKYRFNYRNRTHSGWINAINLFRATSILGLPGSGKSYGFILQILKQTINKGYCAVVYDYKDPTLSKSTYNYLKEYEKLNNSNLKTPRFCYISFKHLNKSNRCNPIKNITTSAVAQDVATSILIALNRKMASQQGEFFTESAKKYTALCIYTLGILKNGKMQSIPHLLSLLGSKSAELFPIINYLSIFYPDMRSIFNPFKEAFDSNVMQQLQGQLASAQIGLSGVSDPILAYVMTEDEDNPDINVDLDVNSFSDPKCICFGNDPDKDIIYGLANSVYLTRLASIINKKGRKTMFVVDELPTVYINHIDTLIATARSNKIAVVLGFQDLTQIIRDYTEQVAKSIFGTTSNIFCGAVTGQTAKTISDSFGDKKVVKISKTKSDSGISVQFSEQKEKKISVSTIEELSQGDFVGRVVDEFENKIKDKIFHGTIEVPQSYAVEPLEIPNILNLSEEEIDKKVFMSLIKVNNDINDLITNMNVVVKEYTILKATTIHKCSDSTESCIYLSDYIEDKELNLLAGLTWLEQAYYLINLHDQMELIKNYLSPREKIEALIRSIWSEDSTAITAVNDLIDTYDLIDIKSVQNMINNIAED